MIFQKYHPDKKASNYFSSTSSERQTTPTKFQKHYPDKKRQNSVLSNLFGAKRLLSLLFLRIDWDFIFHINVPDTAHVQIAFTGCSYKS